MVAFSRKLIRQRMKIFIILLEINQLCGLGWMMANGCSMLSNIDFEMWKNIVSLSRQLTEYCIVMQLLKLGIGLLLFFGI